MMDDAEVLQRRVRELEAVASIASSFTFEQPLEAMMDEVARQVVGASGSAVACLVGLGDRMTRMLARVVGSHGAPEGFIPILERAWRTGGTRLVSGSLQTGRIQLVELGSVVAVAGYEEVREAQRLAGWARLAIVPMVYRADAVGLLIVAYPQEAVVDEGQFTFLGAIADQAAVAVENARLFEHAQSAAVIEERQRLSRELHDSVSQALYGISLGAQTAQEHLRLGNAAGAVEPVDYMLTLAAVGLAEMRALIFELRPETLASDGLVVTLRRVITAFEARQGISVVATLCDEPAIPLGAKETLYRVAQQALNNIAKHAMARSVAVTLDLRDGQANLNIVDDGRGFAVVDHYPGHLGVTGMRERVRREGGVMEIVSAPGAGCSITVSLPFATA